MKLRRFLSVILLIVLLCSQLLVCPAQAVESIDIEAKAAILVDGASGAILYNKNKDSELNPASLTKIMTCLLVLEAIDRGELALEQPIVASAGALAGLPEDGSTADIRAGEVLTVEQLLYCIMVTSANEACNVLAEAVSGSITQFINDMNNRANELGCEHTHFSNSNGLTDTNHYTSAYDIYLITREAMKNNTFLTICSTKAYTVPATNLSDERELHSTNALISNWLRTGYLYDGAIGFKTGTTDAAGHCLCAAAVRGSRTLISVVLGAGELDGKIQSFTETSRLFDWGFDNFTSKIVLEEDEMIQEVSVALSKETDYVVVHPAYTAEAVLPNEIDPKVMQRTVNLTEEVVNAPITAGQELGTITISYNGVDYVTVPLVALSDVNASNFLVGKNAIANFFSKTGTHIALAVLAALVALFVVYMKVFRPRRRYGKSKSKRYQNNSYRGRRY